MAEPQSNSSEQKLALGALIALVVGSMVGSGIFALPSSFGRATGALGGFIAWGIAGVGMLFLALVFQTLSRRKPELNSGIYAYAKAGFGEYAGFVSAAGYWMGCCLADVACLVLIKATIGQFFPIFGDGTTPVAIAVASTLLWGFHFLILRGIKEAAAINAIATYTKIVPILVFIVIVVFAFDADVFARNFWGQQDATTVDVLHQVRNTLLVTVFVFVGIEGASVYSRYAKNRNDVGIATVTGFLGVLCLLVLVTMPSYGILPRQDLAALANPSMAGVLEAVVGHWGKVFISTGLLISVLGNYLSWSLLAAEVVRSAAVTHTMPSFLARENRNKVPVGALWLTNIVIQAFLLVTYFAEYAFTLALKMTSSMTLIPYFLVAAYALKLAWTAETYGAGPGNRVVDGMRAAIATIYAVAMIYAGGRTLLLLAAILYGPVTALFVIARLEQKKAPFTIIEAMMFGAILVAAGIGIYSLATGIISV
jgi:arginine:ornithine antiporter / lysine permease